MDYEMFDRLAMEHGDTRERIAKALGITRKALYTRLKNDKLTVRDMNIIKERWGLSDKGASLLFFRETRNNE